MIWFDLDGLMSRWSSLRVLVVGDIMVDVDLHTRFLRQSNEFAGNVYERVGEVRYPGGAANVAQTCAALGARVDLLGPVGRDPEGRWLHQFCRQTPGLHYTPFSFDGWPQWEETTVKTRLFQDGAFICRVDRDVFGSLSVAQLQRYLTLDLPAYDALLLSDYQKGCFPDGKTVREIVQLFCRHNPAGIVGINPKPRTMRELAEEGACGIALASMNDREYQSLARPYETHTAMVRRLGVQMVLHTMGEKGVQVDTWQGRPDASAALDPVENPDVVGCGDAVFAAAVLARTETQDPDILALMAATAGTAMAQKIGTQPVSCEDIRRLLTPVEGRIHA